MVRPDLNFAAFEDVTDQEIKSGTPIKQTTASALRAPFFPRAVVKNVLMGLALL